MFIFLFDLGELKTKLDIYLSHLYNVRVIRNEEPKGLMVTRQRGIDQTIADVIVVMDSHQEVAEGIYISVHFCSF